MIYERTEATDILLSPFPLSSSTSCFSLYRIQSKVSIKCYIWSFIAPGTLKLLESNLVYKLLIRGHSIRFQATPVLFEPHGSLMGEDLVIWGEG